MEDESPYSKAIQEAREVMADLIRRMTAEEDSKIFKNIAAVYIVWQHEIHNLQLEALNWEMRRDGT